MREHLFDALFERHVPTLKVQATFQRERHAVAHIDQDFGVDGWMMQQTGQAGTEADDFSDPVTYTECVDLVDYLLLESRITPF